jgi:uncharacterized protein
MTPFSCQAHDGVRLAGAVYPTAQPRRGTAVLCHGLPAGRPKPDPTDEGYPGLARQLTELGLDVAIFNFRGTGESGGHLDIDLWPGDLLAVLDHLDTTPHCAKRYAVVGFSAGGAASILAGARDARLDPLIAMAAPADYSFLPIATDPTEWFSFYRELDMIRDGYPGDAASWAARFLRVAPREVIDRVLATRLVLVHGDADDVVPPQHLEILAEAAGAKAEKVLLPGTMHQMRKDAPAVAKLIELLARPLPAEACDD